MGTYRDVELSRQHPLAETLGELTRERLFQRVLLRGLSQQDVAHDDVSTGFNPGSNNKQESQNKSSPSIRADNTAGPLDNLKQAR